MVSRTLSLLLIPVAFACKDSKSPAENDPAEPPAKPSTRVDAGTDEPAAPSGPNARHGASGFRRSPRAPGEDTFTFWGWSDDGRYFAFETFGAGPQMAECEGEAELTIVDAHSDRYAKDGHFVFDYDEPEARECDPPDLRAALAKVRPEALARYGIELEHAHEPVPLEPVKSEPQAEASDYRVKTPTGVAGPLRFALTSEHSYDDLYADEAGAAYRLVLVGADGRRRVVEDGRRRREGVMDYSLSDGMVFFGPTGTTLALFVKQTISQPEGPRFSWMANSVDLGVP